MYQIHMTVDTTIRKSQIQWKLPHLIAYLSNPYISTAIKLIVIFWDFVLFLIVYSFCRSYFVLSQTVKLLLFFRLSEKTIHIRLMTYVYSIDLIFRRLHPQIWWVYSLPDIFIMSLTIFKRLIIVKVALFVFLTITMKLIYKWKMVISIMIGFSDFVGVYSAKGW